MKSGNQPLSEILPLFEGRRAYVRARLSREENDWVVRRIDAVVGKNPPGWRDVQWVYDSVALVRITLDGRTLAQTLRDALGHEVRLNIAGIDAIVPKLGVQTFGRWRPSMARRISERLPWPTVDWAIFSENSGDSSWNATDILAADGCPTFVSLQEAVHAFHTGDFSSGIGMSPSDFALIQVIQEHAWIHKIKVGRTGIDVWIKGESLHDTKVQLINTTGYMDKKVGSKGRVRLPLSGSRVDDARLFLTSGSECLDYRVLGFQYPYSEDSRHGVEYEITEDSESEISRLIAQGEGPMVEYKVILPGDRDAIWDLMKEVVAFANGNGGQIVFGVDSNEVTIVGLLNVDQVEARDRLTQLARDLVAPSPVTEFRFYEYEGKTLGVLSIGKGVHPPYGRMSKHKPVQYYVRRGANSVLALPNEIREAVLFGSSSADPKTP